MCYIQHGRLVYKEGSTVCRKKKKKRSPCSSQEQQRVTDIIEYRIGIDMWNVSWLQNLFLLHLLARLPHSRLSSLFLSRPEIFFSVGSFLTYAECYLLFAPITYPPQSLSATEYIRETDDVKIKKEETLFLFCLWWHAHSLFFCFASESNDGRVIRKYSDREKIRFFWYYTHNISLLIFLEKNRLAFCFPMAPIFFFICCCVCGCVCFSFGLFLERNEDESSGLPLK